MLIDTFKIRSFKSIVDEEIDLGQINVFIGANGSGKSNLLEALGVLSAAVSGRVDDESLLRRGVRPGVPRLYKNAFANTRTPPHIFFEARSGDLKYAVSLNNPLDNPRPAWQYKTEDLRIGGQKLAGRGPRKSNKDNISGDITNKYADISDEVSQKISEMLRSIGRNSMPDLVGISEQDAFYISEILHNAAGTAEKEMKKIDAKNKEQGIAALSLIKLSESDPVNRFMSALRDYAIYAPNTPTLRGMLPDSQTREPLGLSGGRLADAVKELQQAASKNGALEEQLDAVLDLMDWVAGFETSVTSQNLLSASIPRSKTLLRFKDRFMNPQHNQLTAYDASEGALYVLFNAILALSPHAPPCFAIDNLDQALNPRLAQRLMQLLCQMILSHSQSRQALLTVHNPAVLDGLPLQDKRVRLFAVDRDSEGHTKFRRIELTPDLLQLHQEKDWPLSRMWVMGHLGGVPRV